jgi:hypothetical protein
VFFNFAMVWNLHGTAAAFFVNRMPAIVSGFLVPSFSEQFDHVAPLHITPLAV